VDTSTRVWKGGQQVKLTDLAPGDELLVNITGRTPTDRSHCTEIWIGAETQNLATAQQRKKHHDLLIQQGLPAWIDSIDGKNITITFFAAIRPEFTGFLGADPHGKNLLTTLADENLHPSGAPLDTMAFHGHLPEGLTAGAIDCSGVRWGLLPKDLPEGYQPGSIVRVFKPDWITGK